MSRYESWSRICIGCFSSHKDISMQMESFRRYIWSLPVSHLRMRTWKSFHKGARSFSQFKQKKPFKRIWRNMKGPTKLGEEENVNSKIYMRDTIGSIYKILRYSTWDSAQEQLEMLPIRWDSYTINQVLKSHPPMEKAWLFFNWASQRKGFKHDKFTYTTIMDIFGEAGRILSMNYVFQQMQEKGIKVDTVTYTSRMHWLSKAGDIEGAMKTWEEMKVEGYSPTVVSYTAYMKILLDNNIAYKAADVYKEMVQFGCYPNCHTYTILMEYLVECGKYNEALEIFSNMQEAGEQPDKAACNNLVEKCCKAGETGIIIKVLQYMRDNRLVLRYPIFVKALEALRILGESDFLLRQVNPHISTELIGEHGAVKSIAATTHPPLTVDGALLISLVNKKNVVGIDHVLFAMTKDNVQLDPAIISKIIELNCARRRLDGALVAFEYSVKMGIEIGRSSYLALVGGLIRSNSFAKIVQIIEVMVGAGQPLGTYFSALLLYRLGSARRPTYAANIFKMLHDDDKNVATYTAMFGVYFSVGTPDKGLQIYKEMKIEGVRPTLGTYDVLLAAMEKSGRVCEAEMFRKEKRILQPHGDLQGSVCMEDQICDLLFAADHNCAMTP